MRAVMLALLVRLVLSTIPLFPYFQPDFYDKKGTKMSDHLASYYDTIPLGYTITQMQNVLVGNLTTNGWQLLAQSDGAYSDLIPPSTETIGTDKFREVTRIHFSSNTAIVIGGGYQVCIADAYPQSIRLTALTAGAVTPSVTIGGVTKSR